MLLVLVMLSANNINMNINSVGHYPNTALKTQKNKKKIFFEQGSGLSSLGR